MVLKRILGTAFLAMCVSGSSASNAWNDTIVGFVAHRGNIVVQLYQTPCRSFMDKKYKQAVYNNSLRGCWTAVNGKVLLVWEDHTYGVMNESEFTFLWST
jgi:hypothetical protein